jgi:hypothetical protein
MARRNNSAESFDNLELGTDLEAYGKTRPNKTNTEIQFTSHLEGLLKEGVQYEVEDQKMGLTYGHAILAAVVYEKYEMAISELEAVMNISKDYPVFGLRAGRYIQHAKSLVRAIKAKRSIGKLPHVSRAKQKELTGALTIHFNELRLCVINIEKVEKYVRRQDLGATRWFMASVYWSVFAIFLAALVLDNFPDTFVAIHSYLTHYLHVFFSTLARWIWPI